MFANVIAFIGISYFDQTMERGSAAGYDPGGDCSSAETEVKPVPLTSFLRITSDRTTLREII